MAFAVALLMTSPMSAHAGRTVVVLFQGASWSFPSGTPGMASLRGRLETTYGGPSFSSQVFGYDQKSAALGFITSFQDRSDVVVIGHSWGGAAAVEFTQNELLNAGVIVRVLITLDPVKILGDLPGPSNAMWRYNYFQSWSIADQVVSEKAIPLMTPIDVEALYGVGTSAIIHTSIDDPQFGYAIADYVTIFGSQPDLYSRIVPQVAPPSSPVAAAPVVSSWSLALMAVILGVAGGSALMRRARITVVSGRPPTTTTRSRVGVPAPGGASDEP